MTKIDSLIDLYEKRIATLRNLKSVIEDDPDLAAEVMQAFGGYGSQPDLAGSVRSNAKVGQYDRILEFMHDGRWVTLDEVAASIGAKKTSIAPYFYKDETKDKFDSRKHPDKPRMRQWRLRIEQGQGDPDHDNSMARN